MDSRSLKVHQYGCSVAELYRYERNHQGLGNRMIVEEESRAGSSGAIQCSQRPGGMLNYDYRLAA